MKIAVTGTIGSGKSTFCQKLQELLPEFTIVSVDDISRSIYDDEEFVDALHAAFGVTTRKEVSDLVFANPEKRKALEDLSASWIRPKLEAAILVKNVIVEFPLLFEKSDFATKADLVIAVGCDNETQRTRVIARDKMTVDKLNAIRAAQYSRELRVALADVYLDTGLPQRDQDLVYRDIVSRVRVHQLKTRAMLFFRDKGNEIWKEIESRYIEKHRHYHTLIHLHELFAALRPYMVDHPHAKAIELAVWFHDLVYDTTLPAYLDNEALSAREMIRIISESKPEWLDPDDDMHEQVYLAAEIIVATKSHTITAAWVCSKPTHLHAALLFQDADMSILAANQTRLMEYDRQVMLEWGQEPGKESYTICSARLNALKSFKSSGSVFLTAEFRKLEPIAHGNIDHLVNFWVGKLADLNKKMIGSAG